MFHKKTTTIKTKILKNHQTSQVKEGSPIEQPRESVGEGG